DSVCDDSRAVWTGNSGACTRGIVRRAGPSTDHAGNSACVYVEFWCAGGRYRTDCWIVELLSGSCPRSDCRALVDELVTYCVTRIAPFLFPSEYLTSPPQEKALSL